MLIALLLFLQAPWAQPQDHEELRPEHGFRIEDHLVEHPGRIGPRSTIQASRASANFDARFYHLTLDVRFDPHYLYGNTRVVGRSTAADLETLTLDFGSTMQVDSVVGSGGTLLDFDHSGDALSIDLGRVVGPGETVDLRVYYQGVPRTGDFGIFRFGERADGRPYVWSLSEPYGAREWWPCKDHPSDKADSVRVTTTVPDSMRVASNGRESPAVANADGTVTYDWISRYPISTYLVSIAGGIYDVYEQRYVRPDSLADEMGALDMPVVHFAYKGTSTFEGSVPSTGWRHVVDVLPFLEHWFGPYPFPDEKYGHAHVTFAGGMEHQTISSMGSNGLGLIVHELAHQWYGDLITMETWPHLWLNEGFANYSELLWWDHVRGAFPTIYDQVFDIYYGRALNAGGTLVVQDTLSIEALFDARLVYAKGGMVLHMLRAIVGDEVFRQILRSYAASSTFRYKTATTDDFRAVAESVSGLSLDTFFRQWVTEGVGHPIYLPTWTWSEAPGGFDVEVDVEQRQLPPQSTVDVFVMPLTIALYTPSGEERFTVINDERRQTYAVRVSERPDSVRIDPDRQILRTFEEVAVSTEPPGETPSRTFAASVFPNPSRGSIRVELDADPRSPIRYRLFDALGRRVRDFSGATRSVDISGLDLAAGSYFLRIESEDGVITRSVHIVR